MSNLFDHWRHHHAGDYPAGVRLLQAAGWGGLTRRVQETLLQRLASGGRWTETERGKVEVGLRRCPALPAAPDPTPSPRLDEEVRHGVMPPPTQVPGPKAVGLHKMHSHHHALMVAAGTDAARAEQARIIMLEIIPALDKYYDRHRAGLPPEEAYTTPAASPGANEAALIRRLQSLRVRISKLKKIIPEAKTLARRQQLETELEAKRAEVEGIERELA